MEEQDERLVEARKRLAAYQNLVNCQGWEQLVEDLKEMYEARAREVLTSVVGSTEGHSTERENFLKGEAAAFLYIRELPESQIEDAKSILDMLEDQIDG